MNKKIVVAILLLCTVLSMGCLDEQLDTSASVVEEQEVKQTMSVPEEIILEQTLEPAKLEIKDIRYIHDAKHQQGTATIIVKNTGDIIVHDVEYALVTIYGNKQTLCPDLEDILEKNNTFTKEEIKSITLSSMRGEDIHIKRMHESVTGKYNVTFSTYIDRTYIGDIAPGEVKESSYPCYGDPMAYTSTMIVYTENLEIYDIYGY